MRRWLVLTDETARHPYRASLPPYVRARSVDDIESRVPLRRRIAVDARGFVQTYLACFVAVAAFIY